MKDVLAILFIACFFAFLFRRGLWRGLRWAGPRLVRGLAQKLVWRARVGKRTAGSAAPRKGKAGAAARAPAGPRAPAAGSARWVGPGEPVVVRGVRLGGGMVYVGSGALALKGGRTVEPSLIDPEQAVESRALDRQGVGLGRWPSYGKLPPGSRATYLQWLSGGRRDASVAVGYAWLFFYGLERRILHDARDDAKARAELPLLRQELRALAAAFADQEALVARAQDLGALAGWIQGERGWYQQAPQCLPPRSGGSLELHVVLGELARDARPLPAAWAFVWLLSHPETRLPATLRRADREFARRFPQRFTEQFPAGFSVPVSKRPLVLRYQPASPSFARGDQEIPARGLGQVFSLTRPLRMLQEVADACAEELRLLGRHLLHHPGEHDSLRAQMLLPAPLLRTSKSAELAAFRQWLEGLFKTAEVVRVAARDLLDGIDPAQERWGKTEAQQLVRFLESLGAGMEPDLRHGGPVPGRDGSIVLFRRTAPPAPFSPEFSSAVLLVQLAAEVARSDGTIEPAEQEHLEEQIEQALALPEDEARRLKALLRWLLDEPPSLRGIRKRLESVDAAGRGAIGSFMVTIAAADGEIDAAERRILLRLFRLLELGDEALEVQIRELLGDDPPAPAPADAADTSGPSTAALDPPPRPRVVLNMQLVRQKLAESREVSTILAAVFEEEPSAAEPEPATPPGLPGLDGPHSRLLWLLEGKPRLLREDFDELARSAGLMPSGALDRLNEAAFDGQGEAVIEGDDPLEVRVEILAAMLTEGRRRAQES